MTGFRMLLAAAWCLLVVYTGIVIARFGLSFLPVFFGDIAAATWRGQFNADFLCFLILSAVWTAWRSRFSPTGAALAVAALIGGAGFLLPYLLFLTLRCRGDVEAMLLGEQGR